MMSSQNVELSGDVGLLVIDMQNDFLGNSDKTPFTERRPFRNPFVAALAVPGGKEAADSLTKFVREKGKRFKKRVVSEDRHKKGHSATPVLWRDKAGSMPAPFTPMPSQHMRDGIWRYGRENDWRSAKNEAAYRYLLAFEKTGGTHMIWPEHCVENTWGAMTYRPLIDALTETTAAGRMDGSIQIVGKGSALIEEHFGIFWAEVQNPDDPSTQPNVPLLESLGALDRIVVAGLAGDICLRRSVEQFIEYHGAEAARKIVILTDCIASIDDKVFEAFLERMRALGATITTSDKLFN